MPRPTPDFIVQTMAAYQRTEALAAAIELDVFTAIGRGVDDPEALARVAGAEPRGMRILCDFLVTLELLSKAAGRYRLGPEAARFLDRRSADCIADSIRFIASPRLREGFAGLADAVRHGGTRLSESGTTGPDDPVWVEFARGMASRMAEPAAATADLIDATGLKPRRVLDVAAGHGLFGITLAARHPDCELTAQDWPRVLEVAAENAAQAGLADRFHELPGDAFEVEPAGGYDAILVANFLHHFGRDRCVTLLRRLRAALREGGVLAALEYVPEEDRVTPPRPAAFALVMLATTPDGDAYTFPEYVSMFEEAGLPVPTLHDLPGSAHRVLLAGRAPAD